MGVALEKQLLHAQYKAMTPVRTPLKGMELTNKIN